MLDQLFGSKTRVKMIKLFLSHPERKFFVRELTRLTDSLINSIRRELNNLIDIGLIEIDISEQENDSSANPGLVGATRGVNAKKYYRLNKRNLFKDELDALFNKNKMMIEKRFAEKIKGVGQVNYLALSGVFVDNKKAPTDLVVIGSFSKKDMIRAINKFETEIGKKIKFTIMDLKEYRLRHDIADRFLLDILEQRDLDMIIVDQLSEIDNL
ncbi:hypothetical protein COT97_01605 [Candidatus Falkowbacteria bacterium CG10_big_fil_rev_8_21_14_0_10_39_11]|uniref:Transcriptional regulator n=1 Tax=Candidatus Falkowbacteria bacterium CG10_big_fil_rev_8_21_14_0_10_39_11 TaxID=1974565 RepID=A0A2H0V5J9_9BACT|nr:MAG: hypothetical protein COT97_01605 [Candidatus Falkowbacteria bacterium CG10_big_fil_rev_8_21_14_0_10_39_11]